MGLAISAAPPYQTIPAELNLNIFVKLLQMRSQEVREKKKALRVEI